MMVHPVYMMPAIMMSPLPVWVLFHLFAHVATPIVLVVVALPSPIYVVPFPFSVSPSTHATPSLFPPFISSPSSFA